LRQPERSRHRHERVIDSCMIVFSAARPANLRDVATKETSRGARVRHHFWLGCNRGRVALKPRTGFYHSGTRVVSRISLRIASLCSDFFCVET
jgi:hypothetical protein